MSRGYIEGEACENPAIYLAHSWVQRAIRGKRGQAFLRELAGTLDAMPDKRLVHGSFAGSGVCTLGAVGQERGLDMSDLERIAEAISNDGYDYDEPGHPVIDLNDAAAAAFGLARSMVAEIMWLNDAGGKTDEAPEERWRRMRWWVAGQIKDGDR